VDHDGLEIALAGVLESPERPKKKSAVVETATKEETMPIRGVSHVAIGVSDMRRALDFYRDVLGLEVWVDHQEDVNVENVAPYRRHAAYLRWPDDPAGSFIVLDARDEARSASPRTFHDTGMHHFGFWVDDLDAIYERVVAAGGEILVKPTTMSADDPLNPTGVAARATFFRDPDGNILQLDSLVPD